MHARGVHDLLVVDNVGKLAGYAPDALEKQPVAELHDVGFVYRRHLPSRVAARVGEGKPRDPRGRPLRDDLQALDNARHDFVLEPGVQVFGVLADDHQVDVGKPRGDAGQVAHGTEIGVQVQRLAQTDVDAGEAFRNRRGHRTLECDLRAPD